MTTKTNLRAWLASLDPTETHIAIDDDGVTLVACDARGQRTGSYLEVGGVPVLTEEYSEYEMRMRELRKLAKGDPRS